MRISKYWKTFNTFINFLKFVWLILRPQKSIFWSNFFENCPRSLLSDIRWSNKKKRWIYDTPVTSYLKRFDYRKKIDLCTCENVPNLPLCWNNYYCLRQRISLNKLRFSLKNFPMFLNKFYILIELFPFLMKIFFSSV